MDFQFSEEQERLRQEVRQFLREELPPGWLAIDQWTGGHDREFSKKLSRRGWIGLTWPKDYGGQGLTYLDRLVVTEELLRFGAPIGYHWIADRQMGPALIKFGTDKQKSEFLPKIISADHCWCALFSEPDAGSDMSNVQTRAEEVGDEFILNGQKIWTSDGHLADYGWLLAVTDPRSAKKHQAMSEFVVDMRLPGVTVRPLVDASGEHHFNQVFLDNVHISRDALVGKKNAGWYQIMAQMDFERSGIERIMGNYPLFEALISYVKETKVRGVPLSDGPLIRHKLADLRLELEVGRLMIYRVAWMLTEGKMPNHESAMAKVFGTAFEQRLANTAMQILGPGGLLRPESKHAPLLGQAAKSYLRSPSYSIQGGTSEILRGIIALRGLGMPAR